MKVLHVIPSLAEVHGGPSRALPLIERALRSVGVEVETATTDDAGGRTRNGKAAQGLVREDGACRRYFRRTTRRYKVSLGFARWVRENAGAFDLIHIHALFSFTSVVAALVAWREHVPYIVRPLGTLSPYGLMRRRPWLKRLSLALLERRILERADAVHFTSQQERSEAASLGLALRGVVLPLAVEPGSHGAEPVQSPFPALAGRPYVLFLSRLDRKKNVEGLLAAIRLCAQELPDTAWVIAGEGERDYVASLRTLAVEQGIDARVLWAGHIDGEAKAGAFAHAAAFVLPSFSENFGIAAAEAASAGVPCILSREVAICAELADAGGAIAVGTDPASIAAAMSQLMRSPSMRAGMSREARGFALRTYSLEAMGRGLRALYADVLARRSGEGEG